VKVKSASFMILPMNMQDSKKVNCDMGEIKMFGNGIIV